MRHAPPAPFTPLALAAFAAFAALATLPACAGRPSVWDTPPPSTLSAYGLTSTTVVLDDPTHRAMALLAHADQTLTTTTLPIGHGLLQAATSPDVTHLFVLSAGDQPRQTDQDEYPSLTVIDGATPAVQSTRYEMTDPLSNLAIDPLGHWAVAFAGSNGPASFVENPNEIVIFDLTQPPSNTNPIARTIRSFGGSPTSLTFTPEINLPAGQRRLLVIETDQDVTLLDMDHAFDQPPRPEITVQLTDGTTTQVLRPAGVVVDPGDPSSNTLADVAVRTSNDTNVITLQLGPSAAGAPNDFAPVINLTDVGGIPSDFAFVQTDAGLRVAALVPSATGAVLVDPDTSITETVTFPAPYSHLSIVTDVTGGANGTDVALLWAGSSPSAGVAFWTLGIASAQPYRSVEVVSIGDDIESVTDVPTPNTALEVLETASSSAFYVLDLTTRTAAPLVTSATPSIVVSPDGERIWAFGPETSNLAELDLGTLDPVPLYVARPIDAVFDFARDDGGRALVTLHATGNVGATVFDALAPDTATARSYSGLLLEGL